MDVDSLLGVHEGDPEKRAAVGQVRAMRDAISGVEGMQYQPARQAELITNVKANAAKTAADTLRQQLADAASEDRDALDVRDENERDRLTSVNGHAVDPRRFTAAASASEISSMLRDAEAMDVDTLRTSWAFALPVLKQMAAKESREHRLPHANSAFSIWTTWGARMATVTQQAPTRQVLTDKASRRQGALKEKVLSVWRVVGLDQAVARHLLAADVSERMLNTGEPATGGLVFGRFFDQFKSR